MLTWHAIKQRQRESLDILSACLIEPDMDFHALSRTQVECLLTYARKLRYRAPRNRSGSVARYFHARLQRHARDRAFLGFI